jgi:uncharacterized protein YbgA (DUF1722 family)
MTEISAGRDTTARPRVGVSSCLLGEPVRFNGGHSRSRFLTDELGPHSFHARHKLQLLAHDPARYSAAGRVVAAAGSVPRDATEAAYRDVFVAAMNARATRGRHANALHHAFGHISRDLGRIRRADLADRIDSYRRGADPLSVPLAILAHYASDGELRWLAGQSYLEPYPAALRLRHNVPR